MGFAWQIPSTVQKRPTPDLLHEMLMRIWTSTLKSLVTSWSRWPQIKQTRLCHNKYGIRAGDGGYWRNSRHLRKNAYGAWAKLAWFGCEAVRCKAFLAVKHRLLTPCNRCCATSAQNRSLQCYSWKTETSRHKYSNIFNVYRLKKLTHPTPYKIWCSRTRGIWKITSVRL